MSQEAESTVPGAPQPPAVEQGQAPAVKQGDEGLSSGWRATAGALLGVVAAGALVPAGLRLALDRAGSTSGALAVALLLAGVAVGAAVEPRKGGAARALLRLTVAVALAPLLVFAAEPVCRLLWPLLASTAFGVFLLRLVLMSAALLLPALAAGAVLRASGAPIGSGSREGEGAEAPSSGFRPGVSAAAASLGLALGGAVLLPTLGLRMSGLAGLLLCVLATILAGRAGRPLQGGGQVVASPGPGAALSPGAGAMGFAALVAGVALGTAAVCWERTIALLAGPTEVNALIGATILVLGLGAGAMLLPGSVRVGRFLPAIVLLVAGALLIDASGFLVPGFSEWCAGLVARGGSTSGILGILAGMALALPAALAFGGAVVCLGAPVAGSAGPPAETKAGGATPLAPLAAGAAAGVLLGAELLVPTMGLRRGLSLASALGLFALLPLLGRIPFSKPALRTSASMAVLIAMVVVGGFPPSWDPRVTAGGVYRYGVGSSARFNDPEGWLDSRQRGTPPAFYREGRHATVTVERTVQKAMAPAIEADALIVDGRAVGNTGIDARSQILAGEIPMLLHGPADGALVIDFSLGLTAGSVLRHPVRSVTVIEREPAILEASPLFAAIANNPGGDPRLRIVQDDPLARLRADRTLYDVIVVTGTDPWLPHLAGLITDEGYALLRSRLDDKGIVAQRISLGAVSDPLITAWMRAFTGAFPSVLLFQISPDDLLLVGSPAPLTLDPEAIRRTVAGNAAISDDLSRATVIGSDEILLTLRLGPAGLKTMLGAGPSNPDDRRELTVAAARDLSVQRGSHLPERIDKAWEGLGPMLAPPADAAAKEARIALLYRLAKSYLGLAGDPDRALSLAHDLEGLGATTRARWVTGEARLQQKDVDGALKEWDAVLAAEPDNLDALFSLGMFHFDARDYFDAERFLGRAAKAHADTPVVLYNHGRALYQVGRYEPAIAELRQARILAAGRESYPLVDYFVGLSEARLKRDTEAEKSLKAYLTWAYAQDTLTRVEVDAHLKLAEVLERRGARLEGFQERQKATRLQERIQAYAQAHGAGGAASGDTSGASAAGESGAGASPGAPVVAPGAEPAAAPPPPPPASDGR